MHFERVTLTPRQWGTVLKTFPDATLYQTPEWLAFLQRTQGGEIIIAALKDGSEDLGYFTGIVVQKFGFRILGSPLPGWTTAYMGLNLRPGTPRALAFAALTQFAWNQLKCVHLEFMDRQLQLRDLKDGGLEYRMYSGFEIDLTQGEDRLFANMESACRRCIRKAEKSGVTVEEVRDDPTFADDYYEQLKDVFAKQGLVPTYPVERVRALIEHLQPHGMLLLLRARDPEGRSIATGIFPAISSDRAYFWGMASWRRYQILRPNEALLWHAMRYWKSRGVRFFDLGGSGEYKRKYGGYEIAVPWFRISKYPVIPILRETARRTIKLRQRVLARLAAGPAPSAPAAIEAD